MQAILTKFHGPTDHKPARVSAYCEAGKLTCKWDHARTAEQNHWNAAVYLRAQLNWEGDLACGALPNGTGYAFVFIEP